MSAQIYQITGNGLQPLVSQGLQIGQRVRQEHKGKEGVIVHEEADGYHVIFPDGDEAHHQRLHQLSPFTLITLLDGLASETEIAQLRIQAQWKREADRQTQQREIVEHANAFHRHVADLELAYPLAIPRTEGLSEHARAAKNLKQELRQAFPGIKFAVKSSSFTGGDSVDIRWTAGPTRKQVSAITDKYQEGNFNGMIDLYEDDRSAYGKAVEKVLGRSKYVCPQRDWPDDLYEQIGRSLCALQHIEYDGPYTRHLYGEHDCNDLQSHVTQLLSRTAFSATELFDSVEPTPTEERDSGHDWCRIVKKTAPPKLKKKKGSDNDV